ncbi:hypothetical protein KUTeg_008572 [Tegillarca granosa]|uniref:Sulfotransferase domain-containing protein n=1 Tax=Tegillarca granosa TaxID=220873 RepID=A0ABQ9FBP0_TEGGR|nr:hypothetical protein KUTeg_008572 [Tegillarca granosa]
MSTYSDTKFNLKSTRFGDVNVPMKKFEGIDFNFMPFVLDNIEEHLKYLKTGYKVRDDDIFICTYPRSGTNWTYEIVHMLIHGSTEFAPLFSFVENFTGDVLEKRDSPRLLCSHLLPRMLPDELGYKGKIIVVVRNPKDVAVSVHNFLKIPCNSWFDYVQAWEKEQKDHPKKSILTLCFEDMKRNLKQNVQKIAEFLGVPRDESLISNITEKCDFASINKEKTTNVPPVVSKLSRNCPNFLYRKGQIGDWKNWFTVAQNERFDAIYAERMENSDLDFEFCTKSLEKLTL